MATSLQERLKLKQYQVDTWTTREQLCLASAVMRSGDQNWVAVSRTIRMLTTETNRPSDWYSTKNCALQYANLLERVDTPKRKRERGDSNTNETPGEIVTRMLSAQRVEELQALVSEEKEMYNQLRKEVQQLEAGLLDHQLDQLWDQLLEEKEWEEAEEKKHQQWLKEREETITAIQQALKQQKTKFPPPPVAKKKNSIPGAQRSSSLSETSSEVDSAVDSPDVQEVAEAGEETHQEGEVNIKPTPPSPLLTSLLNKSPAPSISHGTSSLSQSSTSAVAPKIECGSSLGSSSSSGSKSGKGGSMHTISSALQNLVSSAISGTDTISKDRSSKPSTTSPSSGASTLSLLLELPPNTPGQPLPKLSELGGGKEDKTKVQEKESMMVVESEDCKPNDVKKEEPDEKMETDGVEIKMEIETEVSPSAAPDMKQETEDFEDKKVGKNCKEEEREQEPMVESKSKSSKTIESLKDEGSEKRTDGKDFVKREEEKKRKSEEKRTEEGKPKKRDDDRQRKDEDKHRKKDDDRGRRDEEKSKKRDEEKSRKRDEEKSKKREEDRYRREDEKSKKRDDDKHRRDEEKSKKRDEDRHKKDGEKFKKKGDEKSRKDEEKSKRREEERSKRDEDRGHKRDDEKGHKREEDRGHRKEEDRIKKDENKEKSKRKDDDGVKRDEEKIKKRKDEDGVKKEEDKEKRRRDEECFRSEEEKYRKKEEKIKREEEKAKKEELKLRKDDDKGKREEEKIKREEEKVKREEDKIKKEDLKSKVKEMKFKEDREEKESEVKSRERAPNDKNEHGEGTSKMFQEIKKEEKGLDKEMKQIEREEKKDDDSDIEKKASKKLKKCEEEDEKVDSQDGRVLAALGSVVQQNLLEREPSSLLTFCSMGTAIRNLSQASEEELTPQRGGKRKSNIDSAIPSPIITESAPNSPASTHYGDDPENEKAFRTWKKSIMILWNEISAHKFASIFLRPITDDQAPGYHSVVFRPMDLQTIKRNIESGAIRNTVEFQRDMMLMFLNAKMYNTIDHNVHHMAKVMMKDTISTIEEFLNTQMLAKASETPQKSLRRETRESSAKRSDDDSKRKRDNMDDKNVKKRRL